MRLFVAVVPPPEAIQDLAQAVARLRREWPTLRWARPDQWHLTLTFLGSVDDQRLPPLWRRLARAASRAAPMRLALTTGGAFGSRRRARVVWVRVDGDRDPLRRLAATTGAAARRCGIPVDDRAYRPHLTLARARNPLDVTELVERLARHQGPEWTVDALHLVHSHLGAHADRGSVYETVASWPLSGRRDATTTDPAHNE